MNATDDKTVVREYFNAVGFERWRRIYGQTDDINKVQLDIRTGHQETVDTLLGWLKADGGLEGLTVCDAGCGVGSLSIPLGAAGAKVYATDISEKMVGEAKERAQAELGASNSITFEVKDLENLSGKYHTVVCLDVIIHYPQEQAAQMIAHLSSLAESRLVVSFAPKNLFYSALKQIGNLFRGPSKATRAYLHSEAEVVKTLKSLGWEVKRRNQVSTRFYFSCMLEATRA